jgi:hypothetical protein
MEKQYGSSWLFTKTNFRRRNKKKIEKVTFLKMSEVFPCGNKSILRLGSGRILLGDNTGGGVGMLGPIGFQCFGDRISA